MFDRSENIMSGIMYFQSRIYLNPKDADAYARLGECFYRLKEYQKAAGYFEKAISLQPNHNAEVSP